jgi:hypothetical protein
VTVDHKAVLRALAAQDGCEASKRAAAHIEYLERQLVSARDYQEQLRRKLAKVRHQRDEARRMIQKEGPDDRRADDYTGVVAMRGDG